MRVKNDYGEEHPNLRGSRLWKHGDLLGAEKSFLASIERNPESDTGYGILAGFYLEQGELEKARSTLKRWKEETPLRFRASYHIMWTQLLSLEAIHEVTPERREHQKQNALFHLKAAIDAGFDNDDIILKDPKLEYIRDTPEFWELVQS
ncbi:MAG: tetratricopeptide repeat protein [Candidatus Poribacteria bacterium]